MKEIQFLSATNMYWTKTHIEPSCFHPLPSSTYTQWLKCLLHCITSSFILYSSEQNFICLIFQKPWRNYSCFKNEENVSTNVFTRMHVYVTYFLFFTCQKKPCRHDILFFNRWMKKCVCISNEVTLFCLQVVIFNSVHFTTF